MRSEKSEAEMSKFKRFALRAWSIPYVKHPLLAIVGIVVLITVAFLFLNIFTEHGAEYEVPDFRGVVLEDATVLAKPLDLRLSVQDSTYNPLLKPHAVIEQYPRVGNRVKHGRRIFLTINSVQPEMIAFPRRAWEPYRTAFAAVRECKLQVGRVSFVRATGGRSTYSPDGELPQEESAIERDFIGHTEVQGWSYKGKALHPGDSLYAGSLVDVVLGLDVSRQNEAEVPSVKGMTLEAARAALTRSLLNVGRVTYDAATVRTLGDTINAVVVRQGFPERLDAERGLVRSRVAYGTPVDLHLMASQREEAH